MDGRRTGRLQPAEGQYQHRLDLGLPRSPEAVHLGHGHCPKYMRAARRSLPTTAKLSPPQNAIIVSFDENFLQ